MKKALIIAALFLSGTSLFAQEKNDGFQFTVVKENPITSTKNQNRSGTCWAFSSLGFFEAELLRMGKGTWDFSEMYLAHKTYEDRAKNVFDKKNEELCQNATSANIFANILMPIMGNIGNVLYVLVAFIGGFLAIIFSIWMMNHREKSETRNQK